jgi:sensor c-di-GMP phosphodiesterase-like protein
MYTSKTGRQGSVRGVRARHVHSRSQQTRARGRSPSGFSSGQLFLEYQPVVCIADASVVGMT